MDYNIGPKPLMFITPEQKQSLKELFSLGLIRGIGDLEGTCIEGAISVAMHGNLSDEPECVDPDDQEWSRVINDAGWSSPQARAEALFPLAIAQIGTAGTDRTAWAQALRKGVINRILPLVLEPFGFDKEAKNCRQASTLKEAKSAARDAFDVVKEGKGKAKSACNWAFYYDHPYWSAQVVMRVFESFGPSDNLLREAVAVSLDAYESTKDVK